MKGSVEAFGSIVPSVAGLPYIVAPGGVALARPLFACRMVHSGPANLSTAFTCAPLSTNSRFSPAWDA